MSNLLDSYQLGDLQLKNRIVMAPLTRSRAGEVRIPNEMMAEYYGQRAEAGLILTEATVVSAQGIGYADTPGIWSKEQIEGWKLITKKVHEKGGVIFSQLWHVGRMSHPMFLNSETPVSASDVKPVGHVSLVRPPVEYVAPRALALSEIPGIVEDFRKGAINAKEAGFDGVEIHGANGYLPDQFLQSNTNLRNDQYGGPIENRARFLLELVDAAISVWGSGRVGVHLSPRNNNQMQDAHPKETFGYVAKELKKRKVAFIFIRESVGDDSIAPMIKDIFGGTVIANEGFTPATAEKIIAEGKADLVSFGKLYISNPDLLSRIKKNQALSEWDQSTMYSGGAHGYTDYSTALIDTVRVSLNSEHEPESIE